jgi:hypothetical protein
MNSSLSNDSPVYPAEMCGTHKVCPWPETNCILWPLLFLSSAASGILVDPYILFLEGLRLLLWLLLLLLRLLIALISRTLATAGAPLFFLHSRYLCRSIPIIQPIISPLILVIRAILLPQSPGVVVVSLGLSLSL